MTLADIDALSAILRLLIILGSVGVAGSALIGATLSPKQDGAAPFLKALRMQVFVGAALIVIAEAMKLHTLIVLLFDIGFWRVPAAALYDELAGFGIAQAATLRVISALLIGGLAAAGWFGVTSAALALLFLASFLVEGHTVSAEFTGWRLIASKGFLFTHMAVLVWWIAVIWPLQRLVAVRHRTALPVAQTFGRHALIAVPLMLSAGLGLLLLLTGGNINFADTYIRLLAVKLVAVSALLGIALVNNRVFTPRLTMLGGHRAMARVLTFELFVVVLIIALTVLAVTVGLEL